MTLLLPWKIGRLSLAIRSAAMNLIVLPVVVSIGDGPTGSGPVAPFWYWAMVVLAGAYYVFFVALPRCRDAGLPCWILTLLLVPLINFVVACAVLGTGTKPASHAGSMPPSLPVPTTPGESPI